MEHTRRFRAQSAASVRPATAAPLAPPQNTGGSWAPPTDSERRFQLVADAAPLLIWSAGVDGRRTWFNVQWLQFVGRSAEDLAGDGWLAGVHPDDRERLMQTYRAALELREPFTVEYRLARADGTYRWLLDNGAPLHEPETRFSGYIGSCVDITDRRRASEAQAYLAAIVESSDDAIISKNLAGIIQSCNASAERLFGYTAAELIGQPVRILIPPDRENEEDEILKRLRRGERIDHFETVRLSKTGRAIDISLTISPVRDASGAIVGASKVARDITERRRAETERREAAAERERLLAAERAARGDAERASRAKDDFMAMVSHELRTPLNAILGWTQLMMRGRQDQSVLDRGLDVIARNTRAQAQLISDLLDISRIVSGKLRLERQPIDLETLVTDAIETVEHEATAKSITLRREIESGIGPAIGDPARLQQVVWNLLNNAIKFTPAGGHVLVTLRSESAQAEIVVSDDGAGIRPDLLPLVFERFHQADRSITRRFGGLGLGLSIARDLVELHGGQIHAESDGEGRGAAFRIVLPLGGAPVASDQPLNAGGSDEDAFDVRLDGIRLLVVDDEPDTREYVTRLLESHGAVVTAAASAVEALSLFRRDRPDMLISDIGLPEIDGYDLMRRIRQEDASAGGHTPAIAVTAYARAEDRTRALRAGYQGHIAKPVEPAELVSAIASFAGVLDAARRRS
jgi:PAS domain S-box-containing protein